MAAPEAPNESTSSNAPGVPPDARPLLRHLTASLAFRLTVALRDAPLAFATYRPPEGIRTPLALLRHLSDLIERSAVAIGGEGSALTARPEAVAEKDDDPARLWAGETERIYLALSALDTALADDRRWAQLDAKRCYALLQGPLADALAHVGQLMLLRRLAGSPAASVRYPGAPVRIGRVGPDQDLAC
ncbi:MAG: hypothetical protein WD336_00375 [Trueperaceae bacterium]